MCPLRNVPQENVHALQQRHLTVHNSTCRSWSQRGALVRSGSTLLYNNSRRRQMPHITFRPANLSPSECVFRKGSA